LTAAPLALDSQKGSIKELQTTMPTKHKQAKITLTSEEEERFAAEAAEKELTLSNLLRKKLKLPALERGARKGNQHAKGNPGRWKRAGG
jgi:hypothetical protein